jgi:hypothetical protein
MLSELGTGTGQRKPNLIPWEEENRVRESVEATAGPSIECAAIAHVLFFAFEAPS